MSKAAEILAANLDSLIGEGRRFRNDADMGERTGLGQRKIHRLRNLAGEPKLDNLDVLSERLHIPIPALVSPGFDTVSGSIPAQVAGVVARIMELARKDALETNDLTILSSAVSMIEMSKGALSSVSESTKRGTGT